MKSLIKYSFTILESILLIVIIIGSSRYLTVTKNFSEESSSFSNIVSAQETPTNIYKSFKISDLKENSMILTKQTDVSILQKEEPVLPPEPVYDLPDSNNIKAIYMTSWVGSTTQKRSEVISVVEKSPILNSIIIDLKDETGVISIPVPEDSPLYPYAQKNKFTRIKDIQNLVKTLHGKGIYVIGRIAVFQDNLYTQKHPESAIINSSTKKPWKDKKGVSWIDPGYTPTWDYVLEIAKLADSYGFDEINFDYVRYPTDTNSSYALVYPSSKSKTKVQVIETFFKYISKGLKEKEITSSVDIFGLLTTQDDVGIGQNLSIALDNFDYVCPMIYPSHYTSGAVGVKDPEKHPYETIVKVMEGAYSRSQLSKHDFKKIRPWVQDFSLKETYGVKEIQDQLRGLSIHDTQGFMVWSPNNSYTKNAYTKYGKDLLPPQ